jgi:hypothetical protein
MGGLGPPTQRASVREPNTLLDASRNLVAGAAFFAAWTRGGWVAGSRPAMEKKVYRRNQICKKRQRFRGFLRNYQAEQAPVLRLLFRLLSACRTGKPAKFRNGFRSISQAAVRE